jgi:hypothetical protein
VLFLEAPDIPLANKNMMLRPSVFPGINSCLPNVGYIGRFALAAGSNKVIFKHFLITLAKSTSTVAATSNIVFACHLTETGLLQLGLSEFGLQKAGRLNSL